MKLMSRETALVVAALLLGVAGTLVVHRVLAAGPPATNALTYSGYLATPDGKAVEGSKNIALLAYDGQAAGDLLCQVLSAPVQIASGRFQLALPDSCVAAVKAKADIWIEIQVDGASLGRTKLGAVPYAIEAGNALTAVSATNATTAANATLFAGNGPDAYQRALKSSCASGIASLASDGTPTCNAFGVFRKGGDDGTASCDVFCAGAQWGGASATGTCVGARKSDTQEWVTCGDTNWVNGSKNGLDCWCSRPTN